jgi:Rrf2 family protein
MFSQTVEYALRAMTHLASRDSDAVSSERIAACTQVPTGYISKVMRDLVVASLVSSFRGPGGGFVLARPANEITIFDVVNAVDPIRRITDCPLRNPLHTSLCTLHQRLDSAMADVERALKEMTLAEVVKGNGARDQCGEMTGGLPRRSSHVKHRDGRASK